MTKLEPIGFSIVFFVKKPFFIKGADEKIEVPFGAKIGIDSKQERLDRENCRIHLPLKVDAWIGSTIQALTLTMPAAEWSTHMVGPFIENSLHPETTLYLLRMHDEGGTHIHCIHSGQCETLKGERLANFLLQNRHWLEKPGKDGLLRKNLEEDVFNPVPPFEKYSIHDPLTS